MLLGKYTMDLILSECLNAQRNGQARRRRSNTEGSRSPRAPAATGDEDECLDIGALQAHADGPTAFGIESRYRTKHEQLLCDGFVVSEYDALLLVKLHW